MAGTIVADTLTHSTAGSITTNYVVEGSAKAWGSFRGDGTAAINDSFNTTSLTDNATGRFEIAFATSMSNDDYSLSGGVARSISTDTENADFGFGTIASGSFKFMSFYSDSGNAMDDWQGNYYQIQGDLA
jgi:hypothetical protein